MKVLVAVLGFVVFSVLILLGVKFFNSATLQTKMITPKEGVECVVVSSTDSTSVDCWKIGNE